MDKGLKNKIISLREKGSTIKEIVEQLKCSKSTVSYHINNVGLGGVRNSFLIGITDEVINKIIAYRRELKSYDEIRSILDIGEDKLIKICNLYGLNKSSGTFKKKELIEIEVVNFYIESKSLRKTAAYFKVDRTTIRNYISDDLIKTNKKRQKTKTKSQAVIDWRKRSKIRLIEYKGWKCECCGYNKSTSVLQFHHTNPSEKDFTIGGKSYGFERLKVEVDKCIMVCANCHIEIHDEIRNFGYSEKVNNIKVLKFVF